LVVGLLAYIVTLSNISAVYSYPDSWHFIIEGGEARWYPADFTSIHGKFELRFS